MDADVDKKDSETDHRSSGDNDGKSESELTGSKIESKDENISSKIADMEDTNKSSNDSEDLNKVRDEAKGSTAVKSALDEQARHGSETDELVKVGGETEADINLQDQTPVGAGVGKQTEADNEIVEQKIINDGAVEENSDENGVEYGHHATIIAKKNPSGNVATGELDAARGLDGDCVQHSVGGDMIKGNFESGEAKPLQTELSLHDASQSPNAVPDEVPADDVEMQDVADVSNSTAVNDELKEQGKEILADNAATSVNVKTVKTGRKQEGSLSSLVNEHEPSTPSSVVYATVKEEKQESVKMVYTQAALPLMGESDDGTPEDQTAFMKEIESFYRGRTMDFKPPKFYGQPLNCLKLWRAVIKLGGYDRVTGAKLWRQVGESFHPPKTCTTVSWTFRIFYEKSYCHSSREIMVNSSAVTQSLLEYEKHKRQSGEIQLPSPAPPEASAAESEGNCFQGPVTGRARRDSAARAMQGWHAQRLSADGDISEPIIKEKNLNNTAKREKNVKSIGSLKQKRSNEPEQSVKSARTEASKQLETSIDDVGPPAEWVKINVRQNKDCFEVYALIPGLLREEIRVQSDPAGRVVITGQPEKVDNPWGITPFRKVINLPSRIDPLQTTAVVSVHGRLLVRLPFEP